MNRLAVVVLNWNGMEDTLECIDSLRSQTAKHMIIVVDNASDEDLSKRSLKELEADDKTDVVVLRNTSNKGFAGGVNTGISYALEHNFTHVALLNPDAIADKNWLKELAGGFLNSKVGIVTGLLLHRDGKTIDSTGDWYSTWGLPFPRARNELASEAPASGYVFGASGGGSIYSATMLREIGLFDEVFFAYYEDVDLSFRAQLAGWKVYYTDKAKAYHKQGASSSKIPGFSVYQTMKNLPLLYIKNVPRGLLLSIGVRFWFAYVLFIGNAIKNGVGPPALRGSAAGAWYFWTHGLAQRWPIQKKHKLPSNKLKELLWDDLPPEQTGLRKVRRFFIGK